MESNWGIIGHQNIISYLENCLKRNRLVHTYLFYGVRHLGKTLVALKFAQKLLNQGQGSKTDLFELQLKEGKKDISIDQVRAWQHWLNLKSFNQGYKVGLIYQVENLNIQSANALLKTIEEPAAHTILILITSSSESLLPTIVSRSQKIHFLPVPLKEIKKSLEKEVKDPKKLKAALNFSLGRPGLAFKFCANDEFYQNYLKFYQEIANLWSVPLAQKFSYLENYLKAKTSQENNQLAQGFLSHFEFILREKMLAEINLRDKSKLLPLFDLVNQTKQALQFNLQPRLALENLMINI